MHLRWLKIYPELTWSLLKNYLNFERVICGAVPHYLALDHIEVATNWGIFSIAHNTLFLISLADYLLLLNPLSILCSLVVVFE